MPTLSHCPKSPVLYLMWNRPSCVRESFQPIRNYQPHALYIAADGPLADNQSCSQSISECKQIVDSLVDWDCRVSYLYRDYNLGCKSAIASAIDWFFENEEYGIIIEDDVVLEDSFFIFAEELLLKYQHDSSVGLISANSFNRALSNSPYSYSFSIHPHIWGWASWRRVWSEYDPTISDYTKLSAFPKLFRRMGFLPAIFWLHTFSKVKSNKINTWDYQLSYLFYTKRLLSVTPNVEQCTNIGFMPTATHTSIGLSPLSNSQPITFPLVHPPDMKLNWRRERRTFYTNYLPKLKLKKILKLIARSLGAF